MEDTVTTTQENEDDQFLEDLAESNTFCDQPTIFEKYGIEEDLVGLTRDDMVGHSFESLELAEEFITEYAMVVGFSICKGHMRRGRLGNIQEREWLCSRQGKRMECHVKRHDITRKPKPLTRVDCKVAFRVNWRKYDNTWICREFITTHSHPLAADAHKQFLRSNRVVTPGYAAIATSLREAGVRTCHIMSYMDIQAGGYEKMRFTVRDLYNMISNIDQVQLRNSYARRAIGYLEHKADDDEQGRWLALVKEYGLQNTCYANDLYERRRNWGETFLRGNFFYGMSTMQRNEGMNAILKKKWNHSLKLYEFIRAVDLSMSWMRHRLVKDDYDSLYTSPQLGKTNMPQIEEEVLILYTRNMLYKVRKEMQREGRYLVEGSSVTENGVILHLYKWPDAKVRRSVLVSSNSEFFVCECQYFLSFGITCRHIFATMKHRKVMKMPKSLLLTQWTINEYEYEKVDPSNYRACENKSTVVWSRLGRIMTKMIEVAYLAARTDEAYNETMKMLQNMNICLQKHGTVINSNAMEEDKFERQERTVLDPHISKTKVTAKVRGSKGPMK
ncbi:protein FAR1-RELATED SEQUENCE 2-like [Humulus lupulus]|uniref:protein FAR1-RELATED SEQUENCE 2-like n=1 Tax=Humulus lupulus TaxID=3486 RepID=UPI002B402843|nr:protein FAR1-RELATED SEQUENCE 2-like [Humulus lupulus]